MRIIRFVLLLFAVNTFAQHQVEGEISELTVGGFHKIKIPHTVRSYSKLDLSDFRIWDSNQNQVPYFVHTEERKTIISNFHEFEIISNKHKIDTSSTFVFKNTNDKILKVVLEIANYRGSKSFNLQGSNDQNQWFGLLNSQRLNNLSSSNDTSVYKAVNFPLCSYKYLKIVFNDLNTLPINLLKIGTAKTKVVELALDEIPIKDIKTVELKENVSQIHIRFEGPKTIDRIDFNISSPQYFNRKVKIYTLKTKERKNKSEVYQHRLASFTIDSKNSKQFAIRPFFEEAVFLEIENQDNPKLEISSLKFFQNPIYVVADLNQQKSYTYTSGDKNKSKPKYDISSFRNEISKDLPLASITSIKSVAKVEEKKEIISFWQQPWFMWTSIGIAALFIVFFTRNLIKDLK